MAIGRLVFFVGVSAFWVSIHAATMRVYNKSGESVRVTVVYGSGKEVTAVIGTGDSKYFDSGFYEIKKVRFSYEGYDNCYEYHNFDMSWLSVEGKFTIYANGQYQYDQGSMDRTVFPGKRASLSGTRTSCPR